MTRPSIPSCHRLITSVGITGTNGKTSTTSMIAAALGMVAQPVARATTVGAYLGENRVDVPLNYHGFVQLMQQCVAQSGRFAAVELTSESMARGFLTGWPCAYGVFTNLTRDHLDAHQNAEHYLASKAQLFMQLPPHGAAILNGCDPASELLVEVIPQGVRRLTYGMDIRGKSVLNLDLKATQVDLSWAGTTIKLEASGSIAPLPSSLSIRSIGHVFAENTLAALLASIAVGVPVDSAIQALSHVVPPKGRFEVVACNPYVVIDYAHTPDALFRTLQSAKTLCKGELSVVFGAGGNRDREKRPLMGEAASVADCIVLTSDNPRDEDPQRICDAIAEGISSKQKPLRILDRAQAIATAIQQAGHEDVVVIAGKGHETEQITSGKKTHFSDHEVALQVHPMHP